MMLIRAMSITEEVPALSTVSRVILSLVKSN
jgi:hypothetical protein